MAHIAEIGSATSASAVSSLAVTLTAGAAVGHTVMGAVTWESSAGTIPVVSVTDSRGNTWVVDVTAGGSGNVTVACAQFRAPVTTALLSGDTVTVTITGGTRNRWAVQLHDFDDVTTSPLDRTQHNDNPGTATALTTGATTVTSQPSELVFAVFAFPAGRAPITPGSGLTAGTLVESAGASSNRAVQAVWQYVTQTGTEAATVTLSSTGVYAAAIGTYKVTAGLSARVTQAKLQVPNLANAKLARITQARFSAPRRATGVARIAQIRLNAPTAPGQRPASGIKVLDGAVLREVGLIVARDGEVTRPALSTYDDAVIADSPRLYLTLAAGADGLVDRSGRNHSVTAVGSASASTFPNGDSAQVFDGESKYVEVADANDLSVPATGVLTLEAWIRPDDLQPPSLEGSGYVYWAGKNDNGQSEYSARMYALVNSESRPNRISGYAFNLVGGLGAGSYFQDAVTAGEWIHYVLVINTVAVSAAYPTGYTKLFKNGVVRDQDALVDYGIVPQAGNAPLRIGTATLGSFFKGAIAKAGLYDYELSPTKVRDHYQLVVPPVAGSVGFIKNVGAASVKTSDTKLTITVPAGGVSAGSTLIVRVAHSYTSGGPTVQDSKGNTYTRDQTSPNAATTMRASLFSAQINNQLQAGDTILLTTSATTTVRAMSVAEFSGVKFSTPLDVVNSTSSAGSTTPGDAIPITTTNADDLLIGFVAVLGGVNETYAEDELAQWSSLTRAGTTGGVANTNVTVNGAYKTVGTTGAYKYQPVLGTSESWVEIVAAYKAGIPTITPTPSGTAKFIQTVGTVTSKIAGTAVSIQVPVGGVPAGHTIIVRVNADYTSTAPTCTDNRGNSYTMDRTAPNSATSMRAAIFSCRVTTALRQGDAITVTFPSSITAKVAAVAEFANVLNPVTIDAQNGLSSTGTAPNLPITTTNANDVLIAMIGIEGDVAEIYTEDTFHQWTTLARVGTTGGTATTNKTINGAYRAVGVAGSYSYAPTLGTSESWIGLVMAYKAT